MAETKGKLIERLSLYSEKCRSMLAQAVELLPAEEEFPVQRKFMSTYAGGRFDDSSTEEDEQEDKSGGNSRRKSEEESSDSEGSSSPSEPQQDDDQPKESSGAAMAKDYKNPSYPPEPQPTRIKSIDPRQHEANIRKHTETLTCHALPIKEPPNAELQVSSSLLSKEARSATNDRAVAKSLLDLANQLGRDQKRVLVLFVRSGRFAGAVFQGGKCLQHRTAQRYTVRKGQGKAQSVQDSQRRPKSVGAQLRRAGEEKLKEDVRETLDSWKNEIANAALIFISCPKTMKMSFYDSMEPFIVRADPRIRRVPLDLGRPTFESVVLIHDVLTVATVREMPAPSSTTEPSLVTKVLELPVREPTQQHEPKKPEPKENPIVPLSALHVAAKNGDLDVLKGLLESDSEIDTINLPAGQDYMMPLHYAAGSTESGVGASVAADMVMLLLVQGKADPERVDARNRPPYFLASHEKVRDSFRIARARLGEEYCGWDAAKVGPPLTEEDLRQRKEKEAEKKKKKKGRQKEKKAKDRVALEGAEEQLRAQEEEAQKAAEAKRIRDGLEPKKNNAPNVCDFCQKVCKGRQRSQMFKRLDYAYCSMDCVNDHKRELVAAAAMARFGSK